MISIITPTYNRGDFLPEIAACLELQSNKNFEWIVVDDGSTDNTKNIIKMLQNLYPFPIYYFNQTNGGKHTAINLGVKESKGKYILILDSDDLIINEAIQIIINDIRIHKVSEIDEIAGLIYQIGISKDIPIKKKYLKEKEPLILDYISANYKRNLGGDRAEIYKKEILLNNPFPTFKNENFLSEGVTWGRISSKGYKLLYLPNIIYICRYQPTGLSAKSIENYCKNWNGTLLFYREIFNYPISFRTKTRYYISFLRRKFHSKRNEDDFFLQNYNILWKGVCTLIAKCIFLMDLRRKNE